MGLAGSGKTNVIKEVSTLASVPLINLNLELSRQMLNLTERKRILQLPRVVSEIADKAR
ncbi:MAG TPA: BREX-3 system P-loop-containing protein BrxF, partial [Acetomicrobium sp.]|nr:BREX-3 system P-loop-containing protein BrxF [Acetomicrobium sp.]